MEKLSREEKTELVQNYVVKLGYEDRITELEKEAGIGQTIGRGKAYVMKAIQKALSGAGQGIKRGAGAVDTGLQRLGKGTASVVRKVPGANRLGKAVNPSTKGAKRLWGAGAVGGGYAGIRGLTKKTEKRR